MNVPERRSEPYIAPASWKNAVKSFWVTRLNRLPGIRDLLLKIWRTGKWLFWKCRWTLISLFSPYTQDIDRVYWVSPERIRYSALQEFNIRDFKGRVIGGDWDLLEKRFEDLDIYLAFKQVCLEGSVWSETVFYQRAVRALDAGQVLWDCRDRHDFDRRCQELEALFQSIKKDGYKSQAEILKSQHIYNPMQRDEEVIVSIGRYGDLLFSDGAHRLAIAKLLHLPKIPVKVAVRHVDWVAHNKSQAWVEGMERGAFFKDDINE